MHRTLRAAAVVVATGGLLVSAAPAFANEHTAAGNGVTVVGDGSSVGVDRATVEAGRVSFNVSSTNPVVQGNGGSNISLFQPKHGVTLEQVFADLREEFSSQPATAATGTRDLVRDVSIFGLADVVPGSPEVVTENLRSGTYYLMDLVKFSGVGQPTTTRLSVAGNGTGSPLKGRVLVTPTSADRFIAPSTWSHRGTYLFHNVADTIHFMAIQPVEAGTTDRQIQAFFDCAGWLRFLLPLGRCQLGGYRVAACRTLNPITAGRLGGVEGCVGAVQQNLGVVARCHQGAAEADRHLDRLTGDDQPGGGDQHAQPFRRTGQPSRVGVGEDHHELLPAVTGHHVAAAQPERQRAGHHRQRLVPRVVAVAVVDPLEQVDVGNQHPERPAVAGPLVQPGGQLRVQVPPVAQPGERVGQGQLLHLEDPSPGSSHRGVVAEQLHRPTDLSGGVAQRGGPHPDRLAVTVRVVHEDVRVATATVTDRRLERTARAAQLGSALIDMVEDAVPTPPAHYLTGVVAGQPLRSPAPVRDRPGAVDEIHPVAHVVHQVSVEREVLSHTATPDSCRFPPSADRTARRTADRAMRPSWRPVQVLSSGTCNGGIEEAAPVADSDTVGRIGREGRGRRPQVRRRGSRRGTARRGTARRGTARRGTARRGTAGCRAVCWT